MIDIDHTFFTKLGPIHDVHHPDQFRPLTLEELEKAAPYPRQVASVCWNNKGEIISVLFQEPGRIPGKPEGD